MLPAVLARHSLKTRITVATLGIFVIVIWSLSFYASRMLREDMSRMLGDQQFSTVSLLAAAIDIEMAQQLKSLEAIAVSISPATLANPKALQELLEQRQVLQSLFSGGTFISGADGTVIADVPLSTGRAGDNAMNKDAVAGALRDGTSMIGRPVMGKQLHAPVFYMAAPIRDARGTVLGALTGVVNLSKPSAMDRITEGRYGLSGGYVLVAPQHRLVVTASDKSHVMGELPAPGVSPLVDRYVQGYEGSGIFITPRGVEVLASAKRVPVAGWFVEVQLPAEEAFAPIYAMQRRLFLATGLLTLLAGWGIWWMLRRQLAPMLVAANALALMSKAEASPHALTISSPDELGQLIAGFNRLLDALRQRDDTLRESEQHFRTLANGGAALIWTSGLDKRCNYFNEPWLRFTGRSLAQEMGNGWTEGVHPEDFERCLATYVTAFDQRQSFCMDYRLRHADGSYHWISDEGNPRYDSHGQFLGYIGFCMDISERKRSDEMLHASASQLQMLSRRVLAAQESERRRVAIELHDELGQVLTAIKINLQAHGRFTGQSLAELNAENLAIVDEALRQVRRLALALRPSMLDDLGLVPALRWLAEQTEARSHLVVRFDATGLQSRLPAEVETACFRIVQESLTNIVRHAGAQQVDITLHQETAALVIAIEDDGRGFDVTAVRRQALAGGSMGVLGMQERATLIGGLLELESVVGQGCRVCLRCPLPVVAEVV